MSRRARRAAPERASVQPRRADAGGLLRSLAIAGGAILALAAFAVVGVWATGGLQALLPTRQLPADISGQVFIPDTRGLVALALPSAKQELLVPAPSDGWIGAVAADRAGRRLAFQRYEGGVSALLVREADGSSRVVAESGEGEHLADPRWSPDGRSLFASRRLARPAQPGEASERVERIDLESGARAVVVEHASDPDPTPDGSALVVLRDQNRQLALTLVPLNGGAPRDLISPGSFEGLISPRVSPNGQWVAVGALNPPSATRGAGSTLAEWFAPVALAHGVPWDVWLVRVDGSAPPRRLSHFNEDSPFPAWSPDGRWLMARTEVSLYLLDAERGEQWKVQDGGGYGGIAWTAPTS